MSYQKTRSIALPATCALMFALLLFVAPGRTQGAGRAGPTLPSALIAPAARSGRVPPRTPKRARATRTSRSKAVKAAKAKGGKAAKRRTRKARRRGTRRRRWRRRRWRRRRWRRKRRVPSFRMVRPKGWEVKCFHLQVLTGALRAPLKTHTIAGRTEKIANRLGRQGWEPFGFMAHKSSATVCFRRPRPEAREESNRPRHRRYRSRYRRR